MVAWIFGYNHIVLKMHLCDLVIEDINPKFFENSKPKFVVGDEIRHFMISSMKTITCQLR